MTEEAAGMQLLFFVPNRKGSREAGRGSKAEGQGREGKSAGRGASVPQGQGRGCTCGAGAALLRSVPQGTLGGSVPQGTLCAVPFLSVAVPLRFRASPSHRHYAALHRPQRALLHSTPQRALLHSTTRSSPTPTLSIPTPAPAPLLPPSLLPPLPTPAPLPCSPSLPWRFTFVNSCYTFVKALLWFVSSAKASQKLFSP